MGKEKGEREEKDVRATESQNNSFQVEKDWEQNQDLRRRKKDENRLYVDFAFFKYLFLSSSDLYSFTNMRRGGEEKEEKRKERGSKTENCGARRVKCKRPVATVLPQGSRHFGWLEGEALKM